MCDNAKISLVFGTDRFFLFLFTCEQCMSECIKYCCVVTLTGTLLGMLVKLLAHLDVANWRVRILSEA